MTVPARRKGPGFQPTKGPGIGQVSQSTTESNKGRYRGKATSR